MSEYTKTALVLGAGGFIGSHMVKRLRAEGYWVRGVDLKRPEYSDTEANEFIQGDLRDVDFVRIVSFNTRERQVTSTSTFHIVLSVLLMRSISLLLIWVVRVLFSVVRTMQISCITLSQLT